MQMKILSQSYEIEQVQVIEPGVLKLGEADHLKNLIRICSVIPEDKKKIVLLHEVLHVIFQQLGFNEEHDNEHLIDCLANSLFQVLQDNPKLFSFSSLG